MKKFERVSLVDGAVAELEGEIRSGRWPVGTRIPPESQLVEQLGMSRTPVREAVRSLVQSGLLVSRQGAGTFVVATDVTEVALRRRLAEADHDDVIQVRDGLDVVAARLAAANRSGQDLAALTDALDRRRQAAHAGRPADFLDADIDFHIGIARASGNPLLSSCTPRWRASPTSLCTRSPPPATSRAATTICTPSCSTLSGTMTRPARPRQSMPCSITPA